MNDVDVRYDTLAHWRGVGALSVMIFHGFGRIRAADLPVHPGLLWLKAVSDVGWFGVHLFFVISGFCVAANVYQLSRQNLGPCDFLRDRLLRIYPAYWAACIAAIGTSFVAMPFDNVPMSANLPGDWETAVANIFLIEPYLGVNRLQLLVSWSLVYELGFYAMVAVGFGLYRSKLSLPPILGGAVLLAIWGILKEHQGAFYVLTFWPEFLFGGVVFAALWLRRRSAVLAILLMTIPVVLVVIASIWVGDPARLGQVSGTMAISFVLFALHRWDSRLADLRALRWLSSIGTISYSLYLTHVPLGGRAINLGLRWISSESLWVLPLQIAYWACSILIAFVFFRLCEQPFEAWRKRLKRRAALLTVTHLGQN